MRLGQTTSQTAAAENWAGKKVLVTGADGFLGSHLVEALLDRGARVQALTRGTSTHGTTRHRWRNLTRLAARLEVAVAGNVASPETTWRVIDLAPDVIFHLAAEAYVPRSFERPVDVFAVNATGTLHVLEAARRLPNLQRVVVTSSAEVYGPARGDAPIDEEHPFRPTSPYGASKAACDRLAYSYWITYGVPVAIVRPFNTYGPRHTYDVIPKFLALALRGEQLTVYGDGRQRRDFTYVDDTVRGFLLMGTHPRAVGEAVNFGTGRSHSIREVAAHIASLTGNRSQVVYGPARTGEVGNLVCDYSKAEQLLGWTPGIGLEDGLARNVRYCSTVAQGEAVDVNGAIRSVSHAA